MRAVIANDEARELMTTFTAEVGLTGILKAFGAEVIQNRNIHLHKSSNPLTSTGPGLYTHQASATASTSLRVVLPLIP